MRHDVGPTLGRGESRCTLLCRRRHRARAGLRFIATLFHLVVEDVSYKHTAKERIVMMELILGECSPCEYSTASILLPARGGALVHATWVVDYVNPAFKLWGPGNAKSPPV